MIMVPAAGIFFYLSIGGMIDSYKHAKFLDKVKGTSHHVKNEIKTIIMVFWLLVAGACVLTAAILST